MADLARGMSIRANPRNHVSAASSPWFRWIFIVYVFLVVLIPGSLWGFNPKYVAFLPVFIGAFVLRSRRGSSLKEILLLLGMLCMLILWSILPPLYGFTEAYSTAQHLKDFFVLFAGCWIIEVFISEGQISPIGFIRLVIYSVSTVAMLKLLAFAYAFVMGIPVWDLMATVSEATGRHLMSGDVRIEFVSDMLIANCIFCILCCRRPLKFSTSRTIFLLSLLLLSALLSFSRFFWAWTAAALALGWLVAKKEKYHIILAVILGAAVLYYAEPLSIIVDVRLNSAGTLDSDQVRQDQRVALTKFFMDAPIMGHGLGTFSTKVIREMDQPYGYELEMQALAGQIGVIGLGALAFLLAIYMRRLFRADTDALAYRCAIFALLVIVLASNFFNPYLTNSTSSLSFGMLMALADVDPEEGLLEL